MGARTKATAVVLASLAAVAGSIAPAAAVTKVAGCSADTWGPVDRSGHLSPPTVWKMRIKKDSYCVVMTTYADGKKPLRITQRNVSYTGICERHETKNSISNFGNRLSGRGGKASYTFVYLSDGTRQKMVDLSANTHAC